MHRGVMIPADEIPLMSEDNPISSSESDGVPLTIRRNPNIRRPIRSSSLWQATSEEDEVPQAAFNASNPENPEAQSDNEQADEGTSRKKQRRHRHTTHQIHELEEYFKHTPNPGESQRREIAIQLGLEPLQVKFWFQNKRTQLKAQQERQENFLLRTENERLRYENSMMKRYMAVAVCKSCSDNMPADDEEYRRLMLENIQLKQEMNGLMADIKRTIGNNGNSSTLPVPLSQILGTFEFGGTASGGRGVQNLPSGGLFAVNNPFGHQGNLNEQDKSFLMQYAVFAMDELNVMARVTEPMWMQDPLRSMLVLNEEEYLKTFGRGIATRRIGYKSEASRECGVVMMSPSNIVQIFMELSKWLVVFSSIVTKAKPSEVLSPGLAGSYSGATQLISAEFRVLVPIVRLRDCEFIRHCKQLNEQTWIIVDFSGQDILSRVSMARCHKRPSGCIIEGLPNGCSKVTWVEHVEIPDHGNHSLTSSIIRSGRAFGAKRWVSVLKRQSERLAYARATRNHPSGGLNENAMKHFEGRQNLMRLAERMVINFYGGVTTTPAAYPWTILSGNGVDLVRIMSNKSRDDPGRPVGVVLCASLCFWMPVNSQTLFNYLRCHSTRAKWDILSAGGVVREISRISNGPEVGNGISVLGVMNRHAKPGNILILQESNTEPTASFVVYAPVDARQMDMVFGNGNQENLRLLPSGFAILPSGPPNYDGGNTDNAVTSGSLVTIAFQMLVHPNPSAMVSVRSIDSVEKIIKATVKKIKTALGVM